jgi:plasmid stabilization system protein ParE
LKKIKYTPDAANKLRAIRKAIELEYGSESAQKIIKSIIDAIRELCIYEEKGPKVSKMFDIVTDYRYLYVPYETL